MHRYILSGVVSLFVILGIGVIAVADDRDDDDKPKLAVNKVKGNLSVMVLGSGGPIATASGRASASYLIFTDGKPRILMDVGGGAYQRLAASGTNIKDLDIILLSHLHADHTGDLTPVIKTLYFHNNLAGTGRTAPVHIYGPKENGAPFPGTTVPQYPSTSTYAHDHYSMPKGSERYLNIFATAISQGASKFSYQVHDLDSTVAGASVETVLTAIDGLVVKAIAVDHGPVPSVAFRIEYKGHSVVYSGDTGSKGPNMITLAKDADLLIYDTAIMDDLPANPVFHVLHTSPTRLGEVAAAANVKELVLSHITPVTEPRLDLVEQIIRNQGYTGDIEDAEDLDVYNLGKQDD
ncbi:MAG: MBL fold metallo-hydrolase [Gammaproteobacteria bacterium]|nr:MBL fold metallo-hydrolase [Gammaproteobacteria bacterium]